MEPNEHTYETLKKKTVAELREIAKGVEHEDLKGVSTMHKEHLLLNLCKALGIDTHEHGKLAGIDKAAIKADIRKLKAQRDTALEAHDSKELKSIRRQIHQLKRKIRKAMV